MPDFEVRLATVEADAGAGLGPFEYTHGAAPDAFADTLVAASARHHGTAGPAFVEWLVADTDAALVAVETACTEFAERHRLHEADGQVQRVAHRFALIAAAGEIATGYGLTGWEAGRRRSRPDVTNRVRTLVTSTERPASCGPFSFSGSRPRGWSISRHAVIISPSP